MLASEEKLCYTWLVGQLVKAIRLQSWTGPEIFRRSRLPDFETIGT